MRRDNREVERPLAGHPIVEWQERSKAFACVTTDARFLLSSREADIYTLDDARPPGFVLKWWKPGRMVDAAAQHRLLEALGEAGIPVPIPHGWGAAEGRAVLAVAHAGEPVQEATEVTVRAAARLLLAIHRAEMKRHLSTGPGEDGVTGTHADIAEVRSRLMASLPSPILGTMHGDFHLGNLLTRDGTLAVTDWTDARHGDTREDLAWAGVLLYVYHSPAAYGWFVAEYAQGGGDTGSLALFEALAALRWLYLARTAPVPINREWKQAHADFLATRLAACDQALLRILS